MQPLELAELDEETTKINSSLSTRMGKSFTSSQEIFTFSLPLTSSTFPYIPILILFNQQPICQGLMKVTRVEQSELRKEFKFTHL